MRDKAEKMDIIYLCPALPRGRCGWEGPGWEILSHFESSHPDLLIYSNTMEVLTGPGENRNVLLAYLGEVYLAQAGLFLDENGYRKLRFALRYPGSGEDALKYTYSLEVVCRNFLFTSKNSNLVTCQADGSIEVNVENILMYERNNLKTLTCRILISKPQLTEGLTMQQDETFKCESLREKKIDVEKSGGNDECKKEHDRDEEEIERGENQDMYFGDHSNDQTYVESKNIWIEALSESSTPLNTSLESLKTKSFESLQTKSLESLDLNANRETKTDQHFNSLKKKKLSTGSFHLRRMFNEESLEEIQLESTPIKTPQEPDTHMMIPSSQTLKVLQCKLCSSTMIPPIFMCPFGHNVCSSCRKENCPFCFGKVNLRNLDLEDRSKKLFHKCRYSALCATTNLKYDQILLHEISCKYMMFSCPLDSFQGNFHELESHMKIRHFSIPVQNSLVNDVAKECQFMIFNKFGVFYVKSLPLGSNIEWTVTFRGEGNIYYKCEICFASKKETVKYLLIRNEKEHFLTLPVSEIKSKKLKKGVLAIYTS